MYGVLDGAGTGAFVEGQMPFDRAADLVEDVDYLNAAKIQDGFYYEDAHNRMYYGLNTFDGGEYLARLVLALPVGSRRMHRGEEQLATCFHAYLDKLHLRFAGHAGVVLTQNDSLHALVRQSLTQSASPLLEETESILASFGWSSGDEYVIAKLVFFEGVHWDSVSLYLCGLLERMMSASCAFPGERHIVWLVNLTHSAAGGEARDGVSRCFVDSLVTVLRTYACKAGVSDTFARFGDIRGYHLETEHALALGQVRDPHYWYYRFSDYAFDYLVAKCAEELAPNQVCHPGLARLAAYDAEHATDYARTLVCYLRNSQNTTHAARDLFIHRTSFMRCMAQIEKLAAVDLGDPDEVLHLLLSAKLIGL